MKLLSMFTAGLLFASATPSYADTEIQAVPTSWRLQNYIGNSVQVSYAGSTCVSGTLTFSGSATSEDKDRFWSLILTAKATGKVVGIFYETITGHCNITSFYAT